MKQRFVTHTVLFIAILGTICIPCSAQKLPEVSPDEYRVYNAVLALMDQMPTSDLRVSIFNVTLNSKCGEAGNPLPLANGCSFLWIKPDNAKGVKNLLLDQWGRMDSVTWADFVERNAESGHLQEPISTPWKHRLVGPEDEPTNEWPSPDLTLFLSRVGFNRNKTEAVVYVLMFSYMDQVSTEGDYFLFRLSKTGKWEPNGRVTYFSRDKGGAQQ